MEREQAAFKHVCKFCIKSFPCGRSLGGHMRSHTNNNNSVEADDKFCKKKLVSLINNVGHDSNTDETVLEADVNGAGYILRENPKKTWRLSEEDSSVHHKVCKECGKGFQSWKALFGHMKCHSDKEKGRINSFEEHDSMVSDSQSDTETGGVPSKKRRSKRRRRRYIGSAAANCSEIEQKQEQEEVALSLMMLSRDERNWVGLNSVVESSTNNNDSVFFEAEIQIKSKSGFGLLRVNHKSEVSVRKNKNLVIQTGVDRSNLKRSQTYEDDDDVLESEFCKDPHKRSKFECSTCKKIFHSYQALGGHRASHRKGKGCFGSGNSETTTETETKTSAVSTAYGSNVARSNDNEISINANLVSDRYGVVKKNKGHECPICLKVFSSGQALGGHKRYHLVAEAKENRTELLETRNPIPKIRDFLDLNMPAPVEEGSSVHIGFKQWWVGTSHKHEPLLGLISN